MIAVRDLTESGDKFKTNAGAAATRYVKNATAAGGRWKAAVDNSEENWNAGIQAAISRGAYKKGTAKVGSDYYTSRVTKLGQGRYSTGVAEGVSNWQEGFKPYADVLNSLTQSAGGPKGDPRNGQRSLEVQIALRQTKEARG